MKSFEDKLAETGLGVTRRPISTVQINVGKFCNQACLHCHVEAGPKRTERMSQSTAQRIMDLVVASEQIQCLDITGGAPELNENFRNIVEFGFSRHIEVIDRCNLTVLFEAGQEDLAPFLASHRVTIIASLPCYTPENVDKQRGSGVFAKSIEALKQLNSLGYGLPNSPLKLHLVYNPLGPNLPGDQASLERDYKRQLLEAFNIHFTNLFTITNMPINRFLKQLENWGKVHEYMELLLNSFNLSALEKLMCKDLVSISWDGRIYDCDFNQMLNLDLGRIKTSIWDIDSFEQLSKHPIAFDNHCFGCTAGAGSSCGGQLI